jgi:hypothetical protein
MNIEVKKILRTVLPFVCGCTFAYVVMSFIMWNRDPSTWLMSDRIFTVIMSWVVGAMLYTRFEWSKKYDNV